MIPRDFTKDLVSMAEEYQKSGDELALIQIEKSSAILALMAGSKSIKEAELKWACTESGKKELILTYKLRGLKELISASKVKIRVANNETYNAY